MSPSESRTATVDQWRSLLAVDDAIARFLATIEEQGETRDTLVVFVSDNGYSLGSHRNPWKDCAYEECIHVPLLVRWPGHTQRGKVEALVGNVDIAPTIAAITGVRTPRAIDGESLVPLLDGERSSLERPVLLRHVKYPRVAPSFWGVRTERWTYVIYEASASANSTTSTPTRTSLRTSPGGSATSAPSAGSSGRSRSCVRADARRGGR